MTEYNPSKIIKDGNTYNFRDTTKIPLAGSNAISGDLVPATDNSIDIGSSTKNIKMLYTNGITIDGTQFLPSDYVPRSGGAVMTGAALSRNVDNGEFRIDGGSDWNKGGSVVVYGKDRSNENENGKVVIHAADENHQTYFSFYPSGYVTLGSDFSFITNAIFQIGSSAGTCFQLRYDGMVWTNSNRIYPANNLIMGLGDSTHKWATLNDVDINSIGFPSTSGIDVTGSLTDYTSGQDVVGKYYITTVPGFASGRFNSSTALRFRLMVYKNYNEMANSGDPIFSLPLTESYEWESLPAPAGSCIMIRPESYISPADMGNTGWTLKIYPNKGL